MSSSSSSALAQQVAPFCHVDVARRAGADAAARVALGRAHRFRRLGHRRADGHLGVPRAAVRMEAGSWPSARLLALVARAASAAPCPRASGLVLRHGCWSTPSRPRPRPRRRRPRLPAIACATARSIRRPAHACGRVVERLGPRLDQGRAVVPDRRGEAASAPSIALALAGLQQVAVRGERLAASRSPPRSPSTRASTSAPALEVLLAVVERVEQHLLDLLVGQAVARLDLDLLLDAGRQLSRASR